MAGDSIPTRRKAERDDRGQFKTARPTVNLLFDACCKVAKARRQSARSYGVLIIIGSREAQFRAGTNPDSHQRFGKIPTNLPFIVSVEHPVFRLEGSIC